MFGDKETASNRCHGVHANTIRMWRAKYAGIAVSDVAKLKQLECENAQMRHIIAQTVKIDAMEDLIRITRGALAAPRSGEGLTRTRLESA